MTSPSPRNFRRKVRLNDNDRFALEILHQHGGEVHGALRAGLLLQRPNSASRTERENNLAGGLAMARLSSLGMIDEVESNIDGATVTVYRLNAAGLLQIAAAKRSARSGCSDS